VSSNDFGVNMKKKVINLAASLGIAGALGLTALGLGAGIANATPGSPAVQAGWEEYGHHWGPGPWLPPPPPAYGYGGYGGYGGDGRVDVDYSLKSALGE
jgi:hypothetical protein